MGNGITDFKMASAKTGDVLLRFTGRGKLLDFYLGYVGICHHN
jgi:hypothetical protein